MGKAKSSIAPQDLDAERGLLGSMLIGGELAIARALGIIPEDRGDMLFVPSHRDTWRVIVALYQARRPVDMLTFKAEASKDGTFERIGGTDWLVELSESVPSAANAEFYALQVRRMAELRDLTEVARQINEQALAGEADPQEISARATESLSTIESGARVSSGPSEAGDVFDALLAEIESRDTGFVPHWRTGIDTLDKVIGGFIPGNLVIVAARPSMGKSALAVNIATNMSGPDRPSLFISLEMTRDLLMQRILARMVHMDAKELRGLTKRDEAQIQQIRKFKHEIKRLKLRIVDTRGQSQTAFRTLSYALAVIRRDVFERKTRVVFVDYLGLLDMQSKGKDEARYFRVQQMSAAFKAIAVELGIVVVLVCQLNRDVAKRGDQRPQMSDLRESGAIEQDADMILLLHRPAYYQMAPDYRVMEFSECIVAKNRDGETGTAYMRWESRYQRFSGMDADDARKCLDILEPNRSRPAAQGEDDPQAMLPGADYKDYVPW